MKAMTAWGWRWDRHLGVMWRLTLNRTDNGWHPWNGHAKHEGIVLDDIEHAGITEWLQLQGDGDCHDWRRSRKKERKKSEKGLLKCSWLLWKLFYSRGSRGFRGYGGTWKVRQEVNPLPLGSSFHIARPYTLPSHFHWRVYHFQTRMPTRMRYVCITSPNFCSPQL